MPPIPGGPGRRGGSGSRHIGVRPAQRTRERPGKRPGNSRRRELFIRTRVGSSVEYRRTPEADRLLDGTRTARPS